MKIINYDFIAPNLLKDTLSNILIMYNVSYCSIKYDNYIEIHFDNYIVRINYNKDKVVFNTSKFLYLILGKEKNNKKNNKMLNVRYIDTDLQTFNNLQNFLSDYISNSSHLDINNTANKYKNANYISKKVLLKNNNKQYKTNTKRK